MHLISYVKFFCSLMTTKPFGWFSLSVWVWKSHNILALLFFTILGSVSHFDCRISKPHSAQMFLHIIPATRLWCSTYTCLPALSWYYVLDCLRNMFAQPASWVISGMVDSTLSCSYAEGLPWLLLLCCLWVQILPVPGRICESQQLTQFACCT